MNTQESLGNSINSDFVKLTNPNTPLEDRILITRQLFPEGRKNEHLAEADTDTKERPVRYFRMVTYKELEMILISLDANSTSNQYLQDSFIKQSDQIRMSLKHFLEDEELYDELKDDFQRLEEDFTLDNYRNFVQHKLPRIKLFKLHISSKGGGRFSGVTGLVSLSVGAPYQPPSDPSRERTSNQEGLPVIEMVIPSDQVYVHPLFKTMNLEMEKEVNVTNIRREWIVDIYNGAQDFAERFIKDPKSVLYPGYIEKTKDDRHIMDYISGDRVWDILQEWKANESIADLIPKAKEKDIDQNNPDLQKPLLS